MNFYLSHVLDRLLWVPRAIPALSPAAHGVSISAALRPILHDPLPVPDLQRHRYRGLVAKRTEEGESHTGEKNLTTHFRFLAIVMV